MASSSLGNCYWVSDGKTPLLIEAGIRLADIRRGLGFTVSDLAGCLVSHEHGDHARAAAELMRLGVDIYASAGTLGALGLTGHRAQPLTALQELPIGTWRLLPFEAVHDAQEPLGFLLAGGDEKLLYLSDSAYCPYRFQGLTHLLVECNHSVELLRQNAARGVITADHMARVVRNHLALERLLEMVAVNDLSRVQSITLIHLSGDNADEALFKRRIQIATGKPVYAAPETGGEGR